MSKSDLATGFFLGVAGVVIGRAIIKLLPSGGRPLVNALGRGGIVIAEKVQEAAAEIGEVIEDTIAELNAAQAEAQSPPDEPGPPAQENREAG